MNGFRAHWTTFAWLLVLLFSAWIYQPGLAGPALLDDAANLERVQSLAAGEGFAIDVVTENTSGPLGRPVSMASFMLDLYYLDAGIRGAKLTNLLIHLLCGSLVLLVSRRLFRALGYERHAELALWTASLWILAPLLVSTTLYIVQRMAQLATLFSLAACWAYLRWRQDGRPGGARLGWLLAAMLSVLLAVLSKENGLLAIPLLILIELAVLQPAERASGAPAPWSHSLAKGHAAALVAGVFLVGGYLQFRWEAIEASYSLREFSLLDRVLTQPRILWQYLGQLVWSQPEGLGLYHDAYPYSTGLLTPSASLYALLAWAATILLALWALRSQAWRAVGFGLLFFLFGHALESTVFPLELYFEHRNYLPAMGIFLALVAFMATLMRRDWLRPWGRGLLGLVLLHAAMTTAGEAQVWSSSQLFHVVASQRFPESVRANEEMALVLAELGDADAALEFVARVEQLDPDGGFRHRLTEAMVYCRSGDGIPSRHFLAWQMSDADFRNALVSENSYNLVQQILAGRCAGTDLDALADHWGGLLLRADPQKVTPKLFLSLAILENHLEDYEAAMNHVEALLTRSPGDLRALMMRLYFAAILGRTAAYEDSLAQLTLARDEGRLNAQERYNLQLLSGSVEE